MKGASTWRETLWVAAGLLWVGCGGAPEGAAVDASPEAVYAALVDPASYEELLPFRFEAFEVRPLGPDSSAALTFEMAYPGRVIPQVLVLADTLRARRVVWRSPADVPFPLTFTWTIEPAEAGSRVGLRLDHPDGDPGLAGPLRRLLDADREEMLARLPYVLSGSLSG